MTLPGVQPDSSAVVVLPGFNLWSKTLQSGVLTTDDHLLRTRDYTSAGTSAPVAGWTSDRSFSRVSASVE